MTAHTKHPGYITVTIDVWLCFIIVGFIQTNRQEDRQQMPAPWHSNVRRSKVKALFRLWDSSCISGRQVPLGPSVHAFHFHRRVQKSHIIQLCTAPLHFAYVQFGGCDWPLLSRWIPVQMSLTEVNKILQKAWIMYVVRPPCHIK